jgi:hypothetical protein
MPGQRKTMSSARERAFSRGENFAKLSRLSHRPGTGPSFDLFQEWEDSPKMRRMFHTSRKLITMIEPPAFVRPLHDCNNPGFARTRIFCD